MKETANVKGLGRIVEAYSDFHTGLKKLKEAKAKPISPRDEAYARIKTAKRENIRREDDGTLTTAGFEYTKGEFPILRLYSRLLDLELAKQAVEANKAERFFRINYKAYEESFKQAKEEEHEEPSKRRIIILPSRNGFDITPKQNWEVLEFLLRDQAKDYFEFHKQTWKTLPIHMYLVDKNMVDTEDDSLLTQLWFASSKVASALVGGQCNTQCFDLSKDNSFRGLYQKSAEGTAKKLRRKK